MILGKNVLKICNKFTGEHPCPLLKSHFGVGFSPVNLLHISRTPFYKETSGGLHLTYQVLY